MVFIQAGREMLSWDEVASALPAKPTRPGIAAVVAGAAALVKGAYPVRPDLLMKNLGTAQTELQAAQALPPQLVRATASSKTAAINSASIKSASERRVRVEDKRIINGSADVNQLVPFKYKWARINIWPPAPIIGCRRKST